MIDDLSTKTQTVLQHPIYTTINHTQKKINKKGTDFKHMFSYRDNYVVTVYNET